MKHVREPDQTLPAMGDEGRERTDHPMSLLMKVVFWFVGANALAGAGSLR